jgi:hypothetical protein
MISLPADLFHYFWDIDPAQLDVDCYRAYVVERLLEYGDETAVRWLLATFPPAEMAEVLRTSRQLSRRSANFWALYFGVDKDDVRCLSTPCPVQPDSAWPY